MRRCRWSASPFHVDFPTCCHLYKRARAVGMPSEVVVVVPKGHDGPVLFSTLFNEERAPRGTRCITVRVPDGCTLMLNAYPIPTVTHLFIEGSTLPPVIHADHFQGDRTRTMPMHPMPPTPAVSGPILPILQSYPRLRVLELQGLSYDVDWSGLEASRLTNLKLWSYENVDRPLLLPPCCALDLYGLVSWYRRNPDVTREFLLQAVSGCHEPLNWSVGYYDPAHVSLLKGASPL